MCRILFVVQYNPPYRTAAIIFWSRSGLIKPRTHISVAGTPGRVPDVARLETWTMLQLMASAMVPSVSLTLNWSLLELVPGLLSENAASVISIFVTSVISILVIVSNHYLSYGSDRYLSYVTHSLLDYRWLGLHVPPPTLSVIGLNWTLPVFEDLLH